MSENPVGNGKTSLGVSEGSPKEQPSAASSGSATNGRQPPSKSPQPGRRRTPATKRTVATRAAGKRTPSKSAKRKSSSANSAQARFPRHPVRRALRIPRAILEQNAGKPASTAEAARFLGGKVSGEFQMEVSSAKKYGFLKSEAGKLALTDRAKLALRPQSEGDELAAVRAAIQDAPEISEVYNHYRGEYLPDSEFFNNALTDRFKVPSDKVKDFQEVFINSLKAAQLIDETGDRPKLIDVGRDDAVGAPTSKVISSTRKSTAVAPGSSIDDSCFVMQPFADPFGGYYETLFKPAIIQAGLRAVRADDEIFGSGKIMDQVWRGIRESKVLIAELTMRNANVYYELGLAHALGKPVVLIAADGEEVPFDVHHIRVIYYDVNDPFWGQKLIDKLAENIQSALANPEEAVLAVP